MKQKESYTPPKLRVYGSVRNLTGGSNSLTMNDAGGSMIGGMF